MAIEVHFTVDELRGDISHLERRLRTLIRDPDNYTVYHSHLMTAISYAVNETFGHAHHVYLRQHGIYCTIRSGRFKGYTKPSKIS
jgi:hypothetical protein